MTDNMIDQLEEKDLIFRFQEKIPVDVFGLCVAMGIDVQVRDDMPKKISGFILKKDNNKFHIFCNGKEPETRQRFTIAHELGHYLWHRGKLKEKNPENILLRGGLSNKEEVEANKLAAKILMPREKIYKQIEQSDEISISGLARSFNVSVQAMSIRLGIPMDI